MANTCTTTYKVTGTRKAVNDLWTVLQKMEVNSKNVWLHQLAAYYGIDYEKKGISARGHIYWAEFEADEVHESLLLQNPLSLPFLKSDECERVKGQLSYIVQYIKEELQQSQSSGYHM